MDASLPILLFVSDAALLSSLEFALSIRGFPVADGLAAADPSVAAMLVVDQACRGGGFTLLAELRAAGCRVPAVLLVTLSSRALRVAASAADAAILEKPLLDEALADLLNRQLHSPRRNDAHANF